MDHAKGALVVLAGLFGSGKSTYTQAAVSRVVRAEAVRTITTRPPRTDDEREGHSFEYEFATPQQYAARKTRSRKWDERTADGAWYGVDIATIEDRIFAGAICILTLAPHTPTLIATRAQFDCRTLAIYLQVPVEVANERLRQRGKLSEARAALQASLDLRECAAACEQTFTPSGDLETDVEAFCRLLRNICG